MAPSSESAAPTILVLEDDADVRALVEATFTDAGFEVETASTVEEAMARVRQRGLPSLAIVDLLLDGDLVRQTARLGEEPISLTPTECRILHILARNTGRAVETASLLRRLWPDQEIYEDALRVHIHRLRRKIEPHSHSQRLLSTDRGLGYRLERVG